MRAAVYLRVSKDTQNEANQEPDCARLCVARGWDPVFFRERESGAKARPEWRRVVEGARLGHFAAVVFWALDRIGRSSEEVAHDVRELARFGVHVASVKDAWVDQPPGPFRDLMLQVVAWFAESERRKLIERTKAGQARARAEGKHCGRPGKVTPAMASVAGIVREGPPELSWAKVAKVMESHGYPKIPPGTWQTAVARLSESGSE